jgi:hypothetical protein
VPVSRENHVIELCEHERRDDSRSRGMLQSLSGDLVEALIGIDSGE